MTPVLIETTAAATIAWTLVAMLKRALPNAPTWIVVAVALIAGQVAAFLLAAQSSPTCDGRGVDCRAVVIHARQ